jgi:vacuolar-type H+-ATPase subunit F/Vma7
MIPVMQLTIAIIGDEDLVNAMRLSGVSRYTVVKVDENTREETRQALTTLLNDPAIGIIVLQEDYVDHVQDLITKFKQRKKMTPIIIDVPSKFGTKHRDVAQYYKTYIKGYIGFDIEI